MKTVEIYAYKSIRHGFTMYSDVANPCDDDYIVIGSGTLQYEERDSRAAEVDALKAQKAKLLAETLARATLIDERIQSLLAIEASA